ncbi:hypothetical protein INT45_012167 [Circinella minor]|uniref:Translational machinery component n=1 Tax=Circinella minor TaxID=1195481 RepID=A0A8H7VM47_9FUNG|nr:hypothetical protein INT45_012167 [Circinella minor]
MLPMYRSTLCKVHAAPNALRRITQARWNTTSTSGEGSENTPQTNDDTTTSNNNKDQKSNVSAIFSILSDAKQRKDEVQNVLGDSMQRLKHREGKGSQDFDMKFLSEHLHHVTQEFHQLHINSSPNNTILTLTRPNGSPLITTSGGSAGFKKAARSGYEAAHQAAIQLLEKKQAKNLQVNNIHVILKGFGAGREAAFKALISGDKWNVKRLTDATPVPFGGCRPKKARRL